MRLFPGVLQQPDRSRRLDKALPEWEIADRYQPNLDDEADQFAPDRPLTRSCQTQDAGIAARSFSLRK